MYLITAANVILRTAPNPFFTPVCFTPFCFNAAYQFTPLLNLRYIMFGLTPFSWFVCIYLSFFLWEYNFFLFTPF
jgi:hypothetical protein